MTATPQIQVAIEAGRVALHVFGITDATNLDALVADVRAALVETVASQRFADSRSAAASPACWSWPEPDTPVTGDPWSAVVRWQSGRCALCGTTTPLVRDHDHYTGMRRGLTCRSCNTHEGFCSDLACRCAAYRTRPPVAILGVEVEHGGTLPISKRVPDPVVTAALVAKIRNRRTEL